MRVQQNLDRTMPWLCVVLCCVVCICVCMCLCIVYCVHTWLLYKPESYMCSAFTLIELDLLNGAIPIS